MAAAASSKSGDTKEYHFKADEVNWKQPIVYDDDVFDVPAKYVKTAQDLQEKFGQYEYGTDGWNYYLKAVQEIGKKKQEYDAEKKRREQERAAKTGLMLDVGDDLKEIVPESEWETRVYPHTAVYSAQIQLLVKAGKMAEMQRMAQGFSDFMQKRTAQLQEEMKEQTAASEARQKALAAFKVQKDPSRGEDGKSKYDELKSKRSLEIYNLWKDSVDKDPMTLPKYNGRVVTMLEWFVIFGECIYDKKTYAITCEKQLFKLLTLFNDGLEKKKQTMHKFNVIVVSQWSSMLRESGEMLRKGVAKKMYLYLNDLLEHGKTNVLSKTEKHFAKWCLCFQFQESKTQNEMMFGGDYLAKLLVKATELMEVLADPLHKIYADLQKQNSPILSLKCENEFKAPKEINSNRPLLEKHYKPWFDKHPFYLNILDEDIPVIKQI